MTLDHAVAYARHVVTGVLTSLLGGDGSDEPSPHTQTTVPPAWAILTRTERRIAELVSQGLTNREIAAQQVVSVRTIDTHVAHVLRKLGLRSRVQLAAMRGTRQDQ